MSDLPLQTIPARYGTATFVPAGKVIKIINTSGTQVVDTWAFALPKPEEKKNSKGDTPSEEKEPEKEPEEAPKPATPRKKSKRTSDLPSQEDAERSTREGLAQGERSAEESLKKGTWSGYLPSVPSVPTLGFGKKSKADADAASKDEQAKNSKTWSSYFAAGKGFSSYIPQQASDTVTQFAGYHARDNNKTYLQQLQDFSKTPVGAAGMAAITGSGYGSSIYAGYSAWNAKNAADGPPMEFLSMPHSRTSTLHLVPKVNDTLVTNLRKPILTLVEDTSPGIHDTLIAACDPIRYKQLGAPDWEQHGSCAENLVLALKQLNERAGLKGAKGVGAEVTVNTVPAPLNLFMNVPWDHDGDIGFKRPKSKPGDFVRFSAERDVVVVMSACPQDLTDINNKEISDAHFILEETEDRAQALKRTQPRQKSMPRKISSSQTPTVGEKVGSKKPQESTIPDLANKKNVTSQAKLPQAPQAVPSANTTSPSPVRKKSTQPPAQKIPQQAAQSSTGSRPKKKPIPPSANASTNGESAPPVERKKPRKLLVRSQTAGEN